MNIAFYTLGCKVNQYESQAIGECLISAGHTIISNPKGADCIIINSCTVTAESDRKTRQAVRRFRRLLPGGIIVLAGCMPQAFPDKASLVSEADIITGNTHPQEIPELINRFIRNGEKIINIAPHSKCEKYTTPTVTDFSERTRAFMKVEDGCDRYCTYCIIPKARGQVRSKPLAEIEAEARHLAEKGFLEIVLVGINLTSYGKDCGLTICDAVSAAAKPDGIKRVRLGSLEPDHISDHTLSHLAAQPKFCPQFHLALQSGCDTTLKRMNRRYDTAFYRDLVNRIRARFENCSITTDIMVGFAGESQEEFKQSLAFYKEIGFARGHVFSYSRREGTVAAALPNQVSPQDKERRSAELISAAAECEKVFLQTQLGKTVTVLFETCKDGLWDGYTENYTRVKMPCGENLSGKLVPVTLTEICNDFCLGKPNF
jgi:threonylcarbamoyladenosine tRNA methylthiotransferase MtaB